MAGEQHYQGIARFFHVRMGPTTYVEVRVTGFEDVSLPTPHERPEWKPRRATAADVREGLRKIISEGIGN
jgi:hypothetical protein